MSWRASVITAMPEMFPGPLAHSLSGKALDARIWTLETVDIRGFARDKHASVDDTPFGGGPGMVMRPDVVDAALRSVLDGRPAMFLSPRGKPFDQATARELADGAGVVLLAGRYDTDSAVRLLLQFTRDLQGWLAETEAAVPGPIAAQG